MSTAKLTTTAKSIVRVGKGRGFVIKHNPDLLVVTAAHCLPNLPVAHGMSYTEDKIFGSLLGHVGSEPKVSAECSFADPVADIAVLGIPDDQTYSEEASAYEALTQGKGLSIGKALLGQPVWALYLDGKWRRGVVRHRARALGIEFSSPALPGMSGSPVVNADGLAVGVVILSEIVAYLINSLPGWLLVDLKPRGKRRKKPN